MKLRDLLAGIESREITGNADAVITSLAYDSRQVTPGSLFVAIRGEKTDGNRFVAGAIERGAAAVASELARRADAPGSLAWVLVADARKALATAAANFYGRPAEALKLVGITGTNGKTTTAYLVDSIFRAAGHTCGMFGTIIHRTPLATQEAHNTTPESLDLQRFLAEVRDAGGTHVTLEVSSHALAMGRVWQCAFAAAVFTNLTRDHLDFHGTFEEYFAAKRRLFEGTGLGAPAVGVVNADDPYGKQLAGLAQHSITYGLENGAEVSTKKFAL